MKSDTKSDIKSDKKSDAKTDKIFFDPFSPLLGYWSMEQTPLYNKWRVKTPGNPIMFANCNSKNTSETGLYIH